MERLHLLSVFLYASLITGLLVIILALKSIDRKVVTMGGPEFNSEEVMLNNRESITFILGTDHDPENPFYSEAEKYYRHNRDDRTEYVVKECLSLADVSEYLRSHPPANHMPWGKINIVSHGNRYQGLRAPVVTGEKRATLDRIRQEIQMGSFPVPGKKLLDRNSEIFIHGCGIGNNDSVLIAMAKLFGDHALLPRVIASKYFENYFTDLNGNNCRYFAKNWFAFYRTGYRPGDIRLTRQLRDRYPNVEMNWRDILKRTEPRWSGDSYHYTFNVPVKWIVMYPDEESFPDISSEKKRMEWIKTQDELLKTISKLDLPLDKFEWRFRKIRLRASDGSLKPAVRIKGYCTILCILQPMVAFEQQDRLTVKPFRPDEHDTTYFGIY
jgi:hypothetical protein